MKKMKKVKGFITEEKIKAARKDLENKTKKGLEDSRIAQIEATKKARETVLD